MFEKIRTLLTGTSMIKEAYDGAFEMLDLVVRLYDESTARLLDGSQTTIDVKKEDKRVNEMEKSIRRDIIEHLSIDPGTEAPASLVLSALIGYIERAGDNVKNIVELADLYGEPLKNCSLAAPLVEATVTVRGSLALTREALAEESEEKAIAVIERHRQVRRVCDDVLAKAVQGEEAGRREAVVTALYGRYLKRVSAGAKNLCTSITAPYDKIGYGKARRPEE